MCFIDRRGYRWTRTSYNTVTDGLDRSTAAITIGTCIKSAYWRWNKYVAWILSLKHKNKFCWNMETILTQAYFLCVMEHELAEYKNGWWMITPFKVTKLCQNWLNILFSIILVRYCHDEVIFFFLKKPHYRITMPWFLYPIVTPQFIILTSYNKTCH